MSNPVITASIASEAMKTSFRDSLSASPPEGSASNGSGRNSARPTSPRWSGFREMP